MSESTLLIITAANFAAKKHSGQMRKGKASEPYINHPIEVARLISDVGGITDADIIAAAILHDTVEDTDTSLDDLTEVFGVRTAKIVGEVTDDTSLPKVERKRLQVEHAPKLSVDAKIVKLADKISNIDDIVTNPPEGWSDERRLEYVRWGEDVVAGLRGINQSLEEMFDEVAMRAIESIGQLKNDKD
ncbi:MAG: bifunctional (p)ppGpp synthetase/guanosine-3',5'-bis(diphosphate) 3'-pyrophosphohydrolase [Pyrinomonadaceae bacterium]|nr:bifunctional (p)ppGpp synthetase/guanosine-3',5'-bis(diphosphate) 3'-pyrophosphohydrolase [Pyrinomonadaceae bacterium]